MQPTIAYIGLGSNLDNRPAMILKALDLLDDLPAIRVSRVSSFLENAPVGGPPGQPDYLNAAAELRTFLTADNLLAQMLQTESLLGRVRHEKWGPRIIDLDLLLFGEQIIDTPQLTVPHPLMHTRAFVLLPLAQIAPDLTHPVLHQTIKQMLHSLNIDWKG